MTDRGSAESGIPSPLGNHAGPELRASDTGARSDCAPCCISVAARLRVGRVGRPARQLDSGGRCDTLLRQPWTGCYRLGRQPKGPGTEDTQVPKCSTRSSESELFSQFGLLVWPAMRLMCRRHGFAYVPASVPNECPSLFPLVVSGRKQKIEVQECEGTRCHGHDLHDPPRWPIGGGRDVSAVHGRAVGCHQPDGGWPSPLRRRALRLPGGDLDLCHFSGPTARGRRWVPSPGPIRRTRHHCHRAARVRPAPTESANDDPGRVAPRPTP